MKFSSILSQEILNSQCTGRTMVALSANAPLWRPWSGSAGGEGGDGERVEASAGRARIACVVASADTGVRAAQDLRSTTYRISRAMGAPDDNRAAAVALTSNERQILVVLESGPLPRAEIEVRTGLGRDTVKRGLQALHQKGFVTMIGQQRSRGTHWARE